VTFSWIKGEYTVICTEPTKGTVDALVITVRDTDIEEVSGGVSAVLGGTSGITGLKGVTAALSAQFSGIDKILAQISRDTANKVNEAKGAVNDLSQAVKQLSAMSKQIKDIGGTKGINLEKLYDVSKDKNQDITYIKNKSEELKAAMELNQKMIENVAKKPVVQSWFEFK
jgi:methyl-accepting chemotaxis protein